MPSIASALCLAGLLAPAIASPLHIFARQNACPTGDPHYGSADWCSTNPEDSVIILATDNKVPYGTVSAVAIMDSVREHCSNGVCESEWTLETMWVEQKQVVKGSVKVTVATQVTDPVHLPIILDSMQEVLDRTKDAAKAIYLEPNVCSGSVCPQPTEHEVDQFTGAVALTMQIREKGTDKPLYDRPVVSSLTLSMGVERSEGSAAGLCGALGGVAGAAAGAINPILGVVGAMAQFGCLAL